MATRPVDVERYGSPLTAFAGTPGDRPVPDRPAHGRRGRMSEHRRASFDELFARYGLPTPADAVDWDPEVLDVGFGSGESVVGLAIAEPDLRVLGVEVFDPGVLALLRALDEADVANVRVARTNVVSLLPHLTPGRLALVRVFFPDPWPKRRHAGRRLLHGPLLGSLVELLAPGGVLHLATDIAPYARDTASRVAALGGLEPVEPPARAETRFERRAGEAGRAVTDLAWRRSPARRPRD